MKRFLCFLFLAILLACSSQEGSKDGLRSPLKIDEVAPTKLTAITKQNLIHLTQIYHLDPYLYTKTVRISSRGKAAAHPVLTLTTKHAEAPELLLADWLHLEFLWWIGSHEKSFQDATASLRKKIPGPSSNDYRELTASFLEFRALVQVLGAKEAKRVFGKNKDWSHQTVTSLYKSILQILKLNKLLPAGL